MLYLASLYANRTDRRRAEYCTSRAGWRAPKSGKRNVNDEPRPTEVWARARNSLRWPQLRSIAAACRCRRKKEIELLAGGAGNFDVEFGRVLIKPGSVSAAR